MAQESTIPPQLMTAALLHFDRGVPIDDCDCREQHKRRLARVSHVYWVWKKNPFLDVFQLFKQLVKGKGADVHSEWRMAQKDKLLFDFVIQNVGPQSRRVSEEQVMAVAKHAMKVGMETDNVKDMVEGAKLMTKVARLDQPESQQVDMTKASFLPAVVVTDVRQVDDTKENFDDEESKRIMSKYNAYVDEKRKMIEDRVAVMEAKGAAEAEVKSENQLPLCQE